MNDYKDVSQVTENVLTRLYFLQTQGDKVRFLWSLYIRLDEEERNAFLQLVTGKANPQG